MPTVCSGTVVNAASNGVIRMKAADNILFVGAVLPAPALGAVKALAIEFGPYRKWGLLQVIVRTDQGLSAANEERQMKGRIGALRNALGSTGLDQLSFVVVADAAFVEPRLPRRPVAPT